MYYGVLLSEWMRKYICLTTLSISIEIIIIGDGEIKSLMYRRLATWFPCQTLYLFNYIHRDCFVSVAYYINWITLSVVLGSLLYGLQTIWRSRPLLLNVFINGCRSIRYRQQQFLHQLCSKTEGKFWIVTSLRNFLPGWTNLWLHKQAVLCGKCPKPVTIQYLQTREPVYIDLCCTKGRL